MKFARYKIAAILLIAVVVSVVFRQLHWQIGESILFGWLTFSLLYCAESFYIFSTADTEQIIKRSAREDLGSWLQFCLVAATCSVALFTIVFWKSNATSFGKSSMLHEAMFISSIAFSWIVFHLLFTFRYAHVYYGDENKNYAKHARGLDFPDDEHPNYMDFAYYSFTIGMTFQVSDVTIKTKGLRKLTLIHSLFSFLFNTILIGITINEIVGLLG